MTVLSWLGPRPGGPMRRPAAALRILALALVCVVLVTGCGMHSQSQPARPAGGARPAEVSRQAVALLTALGASRVYAMTGDNILRAWLGELDETGVHRVPLKPMPLLFSGVDGNGRDIVVTAAGLGAKPDQVGGFAGDGSYLLGSDARLTTLAPGGSGHELPSISSRGVVATVLSEGGFSTRQLKDGTWRRDPRLPHTLLAGISWTERGDAFTVIDANTIKARLVHLDDGSGYQRLGTVWCSAGVITAPHGDLMATATAAYPVTIKRHPDCASAHVIDRQGRSVAVVPAGWDPLLWSAAGSKLLVTRKHELAVWSPKAGFGPRLAIPDAIWNAAPVYDPRRDDQHDEVPGHSATEPLPPGPPSSMAAKQN